VFLDIEVTPGVFLAAASIPTQCTDINSVIVVLQYNVNNMVEHPEQHQRDKKLRRSGIPFKFESLNVKSRV
jgi:hypothetical protein